MRLLGLLGLLAGCGDKVDVSCTDIGCQDGLQVDFEPVLETAGDYEVEIVVDGVSTRCLASLPLDAEAPSSCDEEGVYLTTSGSALSEDQHEITGVYLTAGPDTVSIGVLRDEAEVGGDTLSPTYTVVQPNGPECEPTCRSASASVTIDSP